MPTARSIPPVPQDGKKVIEYLRQLRSWMQTNMAVPGSNITSSQTPGGRAFNVKIPFVDNSHPFKISSTGGLDVSIAPGKVFGQSAPADSSPAWSDFSISQPTPDTFTIANNDTTAFLVRIGYEFMETSDTIPDGGGGFYDIKVRQWYVNGVDVVTDTCAIVSGTLTLDTLSATLPTLQTATAATTYYDYILIGYAVASGGAITEVGQTITQNQNADFASGIYLSTAI